MYELKPILSVQLNEYHGWTDEELTKKPKWKSDGQCLILGLWNRCFWL